MRWWLRAVAAAVWPACAVLAVVTTFQTAIARTDIGDFVMDIAGRVRDSGPLHSRHRIDVDIDGVSMT